MTRRSLTLWAALSFEQTEPTCSECLATQEDNSHE